MNLAGPGGALVALSAFTATDVLLLNGTIYWVYKDPGPGGGAPLGLMRQNVPSIALAQSDQLVAVDLVNVTTTLPQTGVTEPVIRLLKSGGDYEVMSDGTWAEVGNGTYTVRFDERDSDTPGWAMLRVKAWNTAETHVMIEVSVGQAERRTEYLRGRAVHRSWK